jgi:hypothetical protein
MTATEAKALKVKEMLLTTETLTMESKRLGEKLRCSHCMGTGWVVMTAEDDFDEPEEYFTLCRKGGEGSEFATRITREG